MTTRSASDGVRVQRGLLGALPAGLPQGRRTLWLTDAHVEPLLPAGVDGLPRHVLPPGEATKSWEHLEQVLLALDAARLDRDDLLVAVGGGVVTDLGGLAASLHRRGMDWVAVPTSLVGQIDAALGGKTAVNLGGGKNTVGTLHLPRAVLVDPLALASLPRRHLLAGLAEVLKTALIAGEPLHGEVLALEPEALRDASPQAVSVIEACIATKLKLVEGDLADQGPRRQLNLGHTFGHAFEALALRGAAGAIEAQPDHAAGMPPAGRAPDEAALLHGEAVGLGLLCAARLAAGAPDRPLENGLRDRLRAWGLPVTFPAAARPDEFAAAVLHEMLRDKKRRGGQLACVLPRAVGQVDVVTGLPEAALRAALLAVLPPV